MSKLHYYIEQCDNGIVIADRTEKEEGQTADYVEVALDKDICYIIGKNLWQEIKLLLDAELKNAADIEINITPRQKKL